MTAGNQPIDLAWLSQDLLRTWLWWLPLPVRSITAPCPACDRRCQLANRSSTCAVALLTSTWLLHGRGNTWRRLFFPTTPLYIYYLVLYSVQVFTYTFQSQNARSFYLPNWLQDLRSLCLLLILHDQLLGYLCLQHPTGNTVPAFD